MAEDISTLKRPLRVLCIDGGGIRGVVAIQCLRQIQKGLRSKNSQKEPHEIFDLICGTSTGGILAIMLGVLKMSLEDCMKIYRDLATTIFPKEKQGNVHICKCKCLGYSQYDFKTLEDEVTKILDSRQFEPNVKLSDVRFRARLGHSPHVFVVCARGDKPFLYRNYSDTSDCCTKGTDDVSLVEAIRATSAAPTFFDAVQVDGVKYIDGGVGHNNPVLSADLEIQRIDSLRSFDKKFILSLGTGGEDVSPCDSNHVLGLGQFLACLVSGTEWNHLYFQERFNSDSVVYRRLNPKGHMNGIQLDSADCIDKAIKATDVYLVSDGANIVSEVVRQLIVRFDDVVDAGLQKYTTFEDVQKLLTKLDESWSEKNSELEDKYQYLAARVTLLENLLQQKEREVKVLEEAKTLLKNEVDRLNRKIAELEALLKQYEKQEAKAPVQSDLRKEIKTFQGKAAADESAMRTIESNIDLLRPQVDQVSQELNIVRGEYDSIDASFFKLANIKSDSSE